jgi:hypothetical protein
MKRLALVATAATFLTMGIVGPADAASQWHQASHRHAYVNHGKEATPGPVLPCFQEPCPPAVPPVKDPGFPGPVHPCFQPPCPPARLAG